MSLLYVVGLIVGLDAFNYTSWHDSVEAGFEFMAHFTIGAGSEDPRCILP